MQIKELGEWFLQTRQYKALAWESQRQYERQLRKLLDYVDPDDDLNTLSAERVDNLYLVLVESIGMHGAVTLCRVVRRALNVAHRYQKVEHNAFAKMGLPGFIAERSTVPSLEDLYTFIAGCSRLGYPSLGLLAEMAYVFCQRPIDVRLMEWSAYNPPILRHKQIKTGTEMIHHVPMFMQDILNEKERVSKFIIVREDTLQPWGRNDYGPKVAEVRRIMRMDKSFQLRDLRRMGLTEAGDNEATDQEIDTLSGHKSASMRSIYTRRTYNQSRNAMLKRFGKL